MIQVLCVLFTLFSATAAMAEDTGAMAAKLGAIPAEGAELSQFLWKNRPVIVFADSENDPRFVEQMRLLAADPAGLLARDVVVVIDTTPANRSALRQALRPRGFSLVIIGKDGASKIRKPLPWSVREIGRAIDKMPIRLQEIREGSGG
jgi:hypothetical protein